MAKATVELVIPDVHMDGSIYDTALRALDDKVDRLLLVGDFRNQIDQSQVLANLPDLKRRKKDVEAFQAANDKLNSLASEHYSNPQEVFLDPNPPQEVAQALAGAQSSYQRVLEGNEDIHKAYTKEAKADYEWNNERIKELKSHAKKSFGRSIDALGVLGNHDTVFGWNFMPEVEWLDRSHSRLNQGIVGTLGCHPDNGGEMRPEFNGPELQYAPPMRDTLKLEDSEFYSELKDVDGIELILAHSGPDIGAARGEHGRKIPAMAGLTQLKKDTGAITVDGHLHGSYIGWSKDSGWDIRPGRGYVAKLVREGKNLKRVDLYKVLRPAGDPLYN